MRFPVFLSRQPMLLQQIACLCWLMLMSLQVTAAEPAPTSTANHVIQAKVYLRQHGYQLGDMLTQIVEVPLASGQTLDPRSLPLPGPVKPWLDLRSIDTASTNTGQRIALHWQLFATVESAQPLWLPAMTWRTLPVQYSTSQKPTSGTAPATWAIQVPATAFQHSPVFGSQVQHIARKASLPALPYDLGLWQWLTALSAGLALLCALLALWLRDALPWWPFQPGPLLRAHRAARVGLSPSQQQDALYQALCQTAGCVLHAENSTKLLLSAPWLQALASEITEFISAYQVARFGYQPLPDKQASGLKSPRLHADTSPVMHWWPQAVLLERLAKRKQGRRA